MLLNHISGATSFEKLRTVNGVVLPTYREAATSHGLLNKDSSLEDCLEEACLYQIPSSLRHLFSTILVYCNPTNPKELWKRFEKEMSTDFLIRNVSSTVVRKMVLQDIASTLESMGKDINMYRFVPADIFYGQDEFTNREIDDERVVTIPTEDLLASQVLNSEQKNAYDLILHTLVSNKAGAFFVDGPAGTDKTFLYRALLAEIRSKNMIALATASSGVAASILPGGRTAHSRFKIPLNADKSSTCNVSKQGNLAKLLRLAKLIIWDEAPMSTKHSIEALDKMLQDINDTDLPFGGKVIVFGGDFRQVLPVIRNSTKEQQIDSSLASSYLWSILKKIKLTKNMRARLDPDFSHYLIEVGNGNAPITIDENIEIPKEMTIPYTNDLDSLNSLLDAVFGNISNYPDNLIEMSNRAVLTPKNRSVDEINTILINKFPGDVVRYYSFDETIDVSEQGIMEDFLNILTPNGLPPHELLLKRNCPIMLVRNINPSEGLCNGIRLTCCNFSHNLIDARISFGHHSGKRVFIPRIAFLPETTENNGFPFKRTQFPVRLSFAMTVNKSQGQTLNSVGIYLPEPVFSHGQLYVALSRAKTADSVKMLIRPTTSAVYETNYTKNIVYRNFLRLTNSL
ncbi:ATP-dependent DNA helicase pif1-like [Carya illinoinensis]|uniref:ATP-dependent DNA helicase pif1-like n=1 Tax=Carya illinoinensis TaxID=32201 RepID=UPI001C71D8CC|nr:ATP-dependent DNA helicase pif1-like [Carya illinoinensis]